MQRVLIIGAGGAGKSTLARRLAEHTALPLVHLDALYWHAGWVGTPDAEWDRIVAELVSGAAWLMDGNYGRTMAVRLAACDTVIFMDPPRLQSIWRIIKRRLQYSGRNRPDLSEGCPERLSWEFIRWIWDYRRRRRPGILKQLAALDGEKRIVVLHNQADIERFIASLDCRQTDSSNGSSGGSSEVTRSNEK